MTKWSRILIVASAVSLAPTFAHAEKKNAAKTAAASKKAKEANVLRAIRGKVANVSDDKKRNTAARFVSDVRRFGNEVAGKLKGAKGVRKNCLKLAFEKIQLHLTTAQSSEAAMNSSMIDGAGKKGNRAYARVVFAYGQAKKERQGADRCVGTGATYSGETTVEVQIDTDVKVDIAFTPDGTPRVPVVASVN